MAFKTSLKIRLARRKNYQKNKERNKLYAKEYRRKNPRKVKAYNKEYNKKNRTKLLKKQKIYRLKNIEKRRLLKKKWDEKNQCFKNRPTHNYASHPSDAFRTGCTFIGGKVTDWKKPVKVDTAYII